MTFPGALHPPLWHPPVAIVPYFLYAIVEKFPVWGMPEHRNTPPPPMGQGWRKGWSSFEKRISTKQKNALRVSFRQV